MNKMNNIGVNKLIEEAIPNFKIYFPILDLTEELNSISELNKFLKKEKNFWLKHKVETSEEITYDVYFEDVEKFVSELQEEVKKNQNFVIENGENFIKNLGMNKNIYSISLSYSKPISITIAINAIPSTCEDINDIVYAYENFFSNKDVYETYLSLRDNPNKITQYLGGNNYNYTLNEGVFLHLAQQLKKYDGDNNKQKKKFQNIIAGLTDVNTSYSEAIEENKKDLETYIDEAKNNFDTTINEQIELNNEKRKSINDLFDKKTKEFKDLEEAYEQKLHLKAPIEFWNDKSKEYAKKSVYWFVASVFVSGLLMVVGTHLVHMIYFNPANSKSEVITLIPKSFVLVAIVSLLVYILRIFIKVATSNNHLSLEYAQKAALTDFYLSLLQYENESISDGDKTLIYSTLFGKVDTGLIKGSDSNEIEKLLLTMFNK